MFTYRKNFDMTSFGLIALLAFLYFVTGVASLELLHGVNIVNLGVFVPEGIALAFALLFGKRVVIGIFIGQFILAYINNMGIFIALEISLINSLEALLGIMLFKRFHIDIKLKTLRDILGLIIIVVFVLQIFSSLFGSLVLLLNGAITIDSFMMTIFSWWFGNVMGQLLFTPFILLLVSHSAKIDYWSILLYGTAFGLYNCFLEYMITTNPFLLLIFNIPSIIYLLAKKGMIYGTFMSIVVAIITSCSIYLGLTIFQSNSMFESIVNYNLFVLVHTSLVLIVGILFDERTSYEKDLQKRIASEVDKNREQQLMMMQQSRLAQMGEMINMIAHQWRQPLNNLSLVNQLLLLKYKKGQLNDDALQYFEDNSKKQIDLMSRTIDDFRDFFREEKIEEEFDVKDVINSLLEMTQPIYGTHDIDIKFNVDKTKSYFVVGFPNALSQSIINIINNAKDILIEKTENKKIVISLEEENEEITIRVKDNGGGIPADIIDNIFDPYFSTKKEKNGTGLGLYMSKTIIEEQMNAKIKVSNDKDGAVFTIVLKGKKDVN